MTTKALHEIDITGNAATADAVSGVGVGAHHPAHEDGGSDEISLTGLSGTPAALTTHAALTTGAHGMTAAGAALVDDANAAAQRTTLGLGTIATQAASAVAITGGSVALGNTDGDVVSTTPKTDTISAGAVTCDVAARNDHVLTELAATTTITFTNGADGRKGTVTVRQDGTGGRQLLVTASGRTVRGAVRQPDWQADSVSVFHYEFCTVDSLATLVFERITPKMVQRVPYPIASQMATAGLAGWSTGFLLKVGYTGKLFAVRRASDSANADVGAVDGFVDWQAAYDHCGSSNGFVSTLYDQLGTAYNLTETSSSGPQIWSGASRDWLKTIPGTRIPVMPFDGVGNYLSRADCLGQTGAPAWTRAFVAAKGSGSYNLPWPADGGDNANGAGKRQFTSANSDTTCGVGDGSGNRIFTATSIAAWGRHIVSRASGANVNASVWRQNGTTLTESSNASHIPTIENEIYYIGRNIAGTYVDFDLATLIEFAADVPVASASDLALLHSWMKIAHGLTL